MILLITAVIVSAASIVCVILFRESGWLVSLFMIFPALLIPAALKKIGGFFALLFCSATFMIMFPLDRPEILPSVIVTLFCVYISVINGFAITWRTQSSSYKSRLLKLGTFDELTETYSREHIMEILIRAMKTADRYNSDISVCYIKLGNLISINEEFGLPAGDLYIKICIEAMRKIIRNTDAIGRIGGNEFLVIFDQCTMDQASLVMERIRDTLRTQEIHNRTIDFSFGLSNYDSSKLITAEELISASHSEMQHYKVPEK